MKILIKKPLYRTKDGVIVGVYDRKIRDAIIKREPVVIECEGNKKAFSPMWIARHCPTIEKVFLRPDEPMKLYKVFIPKAKTEMLKELAQLGLFG